MQKICAACVWFIDQLENQNLLGRLITLGTCSIGSLILLGSLIKPWFGVTVGLVGDETENGYHAVLRDSMMTPYFKLLVVALLAYLVGMLVRCRHQSPENWIREWAVTGARASLFGAIAVFLYPWAVMTHDVQLASHGAWIHDQHYNATWLGGDVFNNQEGRDDITKSGMVFAANPLSTGVYPLPEGRAGGISISSTANILRWFGYGLVFTEFEETGWLMAMIGIAVLVLGLLRAMGLREGEGGVAIKVCLKPFVVACIGCATVIFPVLIAGRFLKLARFAHARGEYQQSEKHMLTAGQWLPVITRHSEYISQLGYLQAALDRKDTPAVQMVMAVEAERRGRFAEAEKTYWKLLSREPDSKPAWLWDPVSREAYRALIRAGLEDLNSGQNQGAHEIFSVLQKRCPESLKVTLALQYASLRIGNAQQCSDLVLKCYAIYEGLDAMGSKAVLSMIQSNAARAHFLAGNTATAAMHHRKSVRP